jgi:hypothetical protein
VGSEFQVNTYTTSHQITERRGGRVVAADANGNFVVVWSDYVQDGWFGGVYGQRFDANGTPIGDEFRVNSYTPLTQRFPSVASGAAGNFVVVWDNQTSRNLMDIVGQRFDHTGTPQGPRFQANTYVENYQNFASVASDASGNFVVVWQSWSQDGSHEGIFGQRFDSSGIRRGQEFQANSYTFHMQMFPSVASDATGNFVVVWESWRQDGSAMGTFGQRYDSAGAPRGGEFRVNSNTVGNQAVPAVAMDPNGAFIVVWSADDGNTWGIFGQRYDSAGARRGGEFRINSYTTGTQFWPTVASDAAGNFVVTWRSDLQDGSGRGVFGQRFDAAGVPQGSEFQVNSYTTDDQNYPSVAATGTNQFVVVWQSYGQDGSLLGVFGQRYAFAGQTITVLSPNTNVNWRMGSVKEIIWAHDLGLDSTFRIELDRNDDGNFEELIAPDAPADGATSGHYAWSVTGPPSLTARIRVSWTDDPAVSDVSDVTFRIRL